MTGIGPSPLRPSRALREVFRNLVAASPRWEIRGEIGFLPGATQPVQFAIDNQRDARHMMPTLNVLAEDVHHGKCC